jgi:hypothetical protein
VAATTPSLTERSGGLMASFPLNHYIFIALTPKGEGLIGKLADKHVVCQQSICAINNGFNGIHHLIFAHTVEQVRKKQSKQE